MRFLILNIATLNFTMISDEVIQFFLGGGVAGRTNETLYRSRVIRELEKC